MNNSLDKFKQDILRGILGKGTNANNSMTLETDNNFNLSLNPSKNLNFTQVSENSFGIIDTDEVLGKLNIDNKKKKLKKINFTDSIASSLDIIDNNSVVHIEDKNK